MFRPRVARTETPLRVTDFGHLRRLGSVMLAPSSASASSSFRLLGCASTFCLYDTGVDKGYCAAYCNTDADCAGGSPDMICADFPIIERANPADSGSVKLCQKQKSCIT